MTISIVHAPQPSTTEVVTTFFSSFYALRSTFPMSRIVIKFGTSTLTEGNNHLSLPRMVDLVRQMSLLRDQGHEIILVSSGAVAAGRQVLNFPQLPKSIPAKQMLAAVGQTKLMDT
ncbi:MAG TPA: hypothetical protein PK530_06940, partial [Anaerolineales bacterium]|nr:hypothetical protein [Anaerolineales bacterium]